MSKLATVIVIWISLMAWAIYKAKSSKSGNGYGRLEVQDMAGLFIGGVIYAILCAIIYIYWGVIVGFASV